MTVHAVLIGQLLWPQKHRAPVMEESPPKDAVVKFINHGKPGRQPARSDAASPRPQGVKPPPRKATPPPKELPVESAPPVTATALAAEPDEPDAPGDEGPAQIGLGGPGEGTGPATGAPIGFGDGTGSGPVTFEGGSMTPPQRLSGPDPRYTQQALEHEVEGVMEVRCTVGLDGRVSGCRALRSLPFMDREVIETLERRRYLPAMQGGRAIAVEYVFRIELRLP